MRKETAFCSIYVDESHQNTMVGYVLLKRAHAFAKDTPIKHIFGTVNSANTRIKRLAFKLGWKHLAMLPDTVSNKTITF